MKEQAWKKALVEATLEAATHKLCGIVEKFLGHDYGCSIVVSRDSDVHDSMMFGTLDPARIAAVVTDRADEIEVFDQDPTLTPAQERAKIVGETFDRWGIK